MAKAAKEKPAKSGSKSKMLVYIGAFFFSYIVICGIMYFLLKDKYASNQPETAPADSAALAQMDSTAADSLAKSDSTALVTDSTALAADTSVHKDSLALTAVDTMKAPAAAPETTLAAIPDTVVDTAIIALLGKKPAEADTAALAAYQKRVSKLVKIIDKMKPVDTASVFSKLDDELVLQLLLRMKDRNAAKVLSQMPPSRAARLTAKLGSQTAG